MPSISMSPDARYVTQQAVYSSPFTGPLTDRKIARYQKQGYYGGGLVLREAKRRRRTKNPLQTLLGKYL